MTKTRFDTYSVQGESFVSEETDIQLNFSVHTDRKIVSTSSVFLTLEEAIDLAKELNAVINQLSN